MYLKNIKISVELFKKLNFIPCIAHLQTKSIEVCVKKKKKEKIL